MTDPLIGAIALGSLLFVVTFAAVMAPWSKLLGLRNSTGYVPPTSAEGQNSKRGSVRSQAKPSSTGKNTSVFASWACGIGAALCGFFAIYIAASVPNRGYIGALQAQTNELLFAVIMAILALALAVAAAFFGLRTNR